MVLDDEVTQLRLAYSITNWLINQPILAGSDWQMVRGYDLADGVQLGRIYPSRTWLTILHFHFQPCHLVTNGIALQTTSIIVEGYGSTADIPRLQYHLVTNEIGSKPPQSL